MTERPVAPLEERLHPVPVQLKLDSITEVAIAAEDELRLGAVEDRDRCGGYFPALAGLSGIRTELPACRAFADAVPAIAHSGLSYRFNFLRQFARVRTRLAIDSDAASARPVTRAL